MHMLRAVGLILILICVPQPTLSNAVPVKPPLPSETFTGDLDQMFERRTIRVLVPFNSTLYFIDRGQPRGIVHDMFAQFEKTVNRKYRSKLPITVLFIPVARERLFEALHAGLGDIVAANLTVTEERKQQVDFSLPFLSGIDEIVVTRVGEPPLQSIDDLSGRTVFTRPNSASYESLTRLNREFESRGMPSVRLVHAPGSFETEDLLEMVDSGLVPIVIADSHLVALWNRIFRNLVVYAAIKLREDADIAWAIRKNSPLLKGALDEFAKTHGEKSVFGAVTLRKYLSSIRYAQSAFEADAHLRFNGLKPFFDQFGHRYRVDPLLAAAQGFQESRLQQSARSRAGAIGVMQLLPSTGADMAVGDIRRVEPNIHAGIKYNRWTIDRYLAGDDADELNKVLFMLAGYNAGPGRIRQLRRETARRGLNPNIWFDNVEVVVLERVGREPVQYVNNIYKYYIAYSLLESEEKVREEVKAKQNEEGWTPKDASS